LLFSRITFAQNRDSLLREWEQAADTEVSLFYKVSQIDTALLRIFPQWKYMSEVNSSIKPYGARPDYLFFAVKSGNHWVVYTAGKYSTQCFFITHTDNGGYIIYDSSEKFTKWDDLKNALDKMIVQLKFYGKYDH